MQRGVAFAGGAVLGAGVLIGWLVERRRKRARPRRGPSPDLLERYRLAAAV